MKILVTGGAGYIGSVAVSQLLAKGYTVVVIDNLSKGVRSLVPKGADFYEGDLCDSTFVSSVFKKHTFDSVIHFAAYKAVDESLHNVAKYSDNITGTIVLLNAMATHKVSRIVFSSSAAVYGVPEIDIIDETVDPAPINYYGFTKLEMERIMKWYADCYGMHCVMLRYFNVAGDGGLGYIDPFAKNIFPILAEVLTGKRERIEVFGNDYPTRDGTCVRDYIHVIDLIDAHINALSVDGFHVVNLGTSHGSTVLELIKVFEEVSGKKILYSITGRRDGDPACLVASSEKALKLLQWKPQLDIKEMVASTLKAYDLSTAEEK